DIVDGVVAGAVAAKDERRREEGAAVGAFAERAKALVRADPDLVEGGELRDAGGDVGLLRLRRERTHLHALDRRVADAHLGETIAQPCRQRTQVSTRDD